MIEFFQTVAILFVRSPSGLGRLPGVSRCTEVQARIRRRRGCEVGWLFLISGGRLRAPGILDLAVKCVKGAGALRCVPSPDVRGPRGVVRI